MLPGLASLRIPARASVLVAFGIVVGAGIFFLAHPRGWRPAGLIALLATLSLVAVVLFLLKLGAVGWAVRGRVLVRVGGPVAARLAALGYGWPARARPRWFAGLLA